MLSSSLDAVDAAMGQTLRKYRKAAGLSQAELGQAVGVSFQQIQKYETGDNRVSISRLFRIAEKLEVEPVTLVADTQRQIDRPAEPQGQRSAFLATGEGVRAIEALAALKDSELIEALIGLAEAARTGDRPGHADRP